MKSALIFLAVTTAALANTNEESCLRDGVHADFESDCQEYFRCVGGTVKARYSCSKGRMFSEAAGGCVPRGRLGGCTRRRCAPADASAYATPGTACRNYYRCGNGSVVAEHACPAGAWFDVHLQACTHGAGTCFEPICTGLVNGDYPDASQDCRRTMSCFGGAVADVTSCGGGQCNVQCPAPRSVTIPVPAGDADFCPDAACASMCAKVKDGAYPDRTSGCREFFVCESGKIIRRGACEPGRLFADGTCVDAGEVRCEAPARGPCSNRADGLHRDWRGCDTWYECRREQLVSRGSCPVGSVFDGARCVPSKDFYCEHPRISAVCENRPSGFYQDYSSNCTRYFRCEGGKLTVFACRVGRVFDGAACVSVNDYECPSLARDTCYGRPDGRYKPIESDCRSFYTCAAGQKTIYACPTGYKFEDGKCVRAPAGQCPRSSSCTGLADGYHADVQSGCRRYFYCEAGERLTVMYCKGGNMFDGRSCAAPAGRRCGAPPPTTPTPAGECPSDGFFSVDGTKCKSYYFCIDGRRTDLNCPDGQLFNGQVCVPSSLFTCPG